MIYLFNANRWEFEVLYACRYIDINFCRNWTVKSAFDFIKLLSGMCVLRIHFARNIVSRLKKLFERILIISDSWSLSRNPYREINKYN